MIGKITLSKEQAENIKLWVNKEQLIIAKATGLLEHGRDEAVREMSMEHLVRALYIGYEIEDEYKVGDWVVVEDCPCERIIGKVQKITEIIKYNNRTQFEYEDWWSNEHETKIRHATPEEIKAEKERRVWKSIGREVGEFHVKDAYTRTDGSTFVIDDESRTKAIRRLYEMGMLKGFYPAEYFIEFGGEEE